MPAIATFHGQKPVVATVFPSGVELWHPMQAACPLGVAGSLTGMVGGVVLGPELVGLIALAPFWSPPELWSITDWIWSG